MCPVRCTPESCSAHQGMHRGTLAAAALGSTGQQLLCSDKDMQKIMENGKKVHQTFRICFWTDTEA